MGISGVMLYRTALVAYQLAPKGLVARLEVLVEHHTGEVSVWVRSPPELIIIILLLLHRFYKLLEIAIVDH